MTYVVQARSDLSATAETTKEALAKAVEWQVVYKFANVTVINGVRIFTIAELG
jgi:hypothetical protein